MYGSFIKPERLLESVLKVHGYVAMCSSSA